MLLLLKLDLVLLLLYWLLLTLVFIFKSIPLSVNGFVEEFPVLAIALLGLRLQHDKQRQTEGTYFSRKANKFFINIRKRGL